ncbi:hypothetical protein RND71_015943 [Anisodus tanguticus]|uniref:Uncharacterized protein n=1 Tax=Anisodus tanguticus TaxID=243964 RepID=A0AAE1VLL1_9SOLA|nr:hypothetical protein RND71_015943 [Anisodus tanguticus]
MLKIRYIPFYFSSQSFATLQSILEERLRIGGERSWRRAISRSVHLLSYAFFRDGACGGVNLVALIRWTQARQRPCVHIPRFTRWWGLEEGPVPSPPGA